MKGGAYVRNWPRLCEKAQELVGRNERRQLSLERMQNSV